MVRVMHVSVCQLNYGKACLIPIIILQGKMKNIGDTVVLVDNRFIPITTVLLDAVINDVRIFKEVLIKLPQMREFFINKKPNSD